MKEKIIGYVTVMLAVVLFIGGLQAKAVDANTTDTAFSFNVDGHAPSAYTSTGYRLKYNSSSVYIYPKSCDSTVKSFQVQVYGAKNNKGDGATNCGKNKTSLVVKSGNVYYYATTINGTNYTHAKLRGAGHDGYGKAAGVWSPDNSSGIAVDKVVAK